MTFHPTPFTPYDTSDWTAAKECNDVSHDVARERAPQPGTPLRRPGDSDADYAALLAWYEYLADEEAAEIEFADDGLGDEFEADLENWEASR